MSTPREQYDAMLDELDAESKLHLIDHVPFAKVLEELDPIAYRCGCSDFQASCDECHHEYWADDPDDEAVCEDCREEMQAAERADDAADEGDDNA
jgi:uncharacterized paraquat-inducible protein A